MAGLTVFFAPAGVCRGIRERLHDWNALGVVADFVWVEPSGLGDYDAAVLHVRSGRLAGSDLQSVVADIAPRTAQLCVLVPVGGAAAAIEPAQENHLAEVVARVSRVPVARVRIVLARAGASLAAELVAHEGWHNLVLSPEDKAGPRTPPVRLGVTDDPLDVARYACHGLAGALGLWVGVGGAPKELHDTPPPGSSARLVAGYYRQLIAADVESALRESVLSMAQGFPRPTRHGAPLAVVPDADLAAATMADQWWERHQHSLYGPRAELTSEPPQPIGAMAALKMFFSFIMAALRSAPRTWYERIVGGVAAGIAHRVNRAVLGDDSAYVVIVRGVGPDGMPAGWHTTGEAAARLEGALDRAGLDGGQDPRSDLGTLWEEFAAGALTLADGQGRVDAMPPAYTGTDFAVVRSPAALAGSPQDVFELPAAQLAATLGAEPVLPADILAQRDLAARLAALSGTPGLEQQVGAARDRLGRWAAHHAGAYAVRVATHVADAHARVVNEVRYWSELLAAAAGADDGAHRDEQARLARRMRMLTVIVLVLLVVVGVVTGVGLIGVGLGVAIGAVVLLGGVAGMFRMFWIGQRNLFRYLNRRRELAKQEEIAARNLRAALRDLRRITAGYGQLMEWCRVLGAFLLAPYGPTPPTAVSALRFAADMPRGMAIGIAEAEPAAVAQVSADIRRETFGVGWLGGPWDALLIDARNRLEPEARDGLDTPRAMFGKLSRVTLGADSQLSAWSDEIVRAGVGSANGARMWAELAGALQAAPARADLLMGRVRIVGSGEVVPADRFLAGIADAQAPVEYFDTVLLDASGRSGDAARALPSRPLVAASGLSRVFARTEFSETIPAYGFQGAVAIPPPDPAADGTVGGTDGGWTPPVPRRPNPSF